MARLTTVLFLILVGLTPFAGDPASASTQTAGPGRESLIRTALEFQDAGSPAKAAEIWEKIVPLPVYGPAAEIMLARCRTKMNRPDQAASVLRQFLEKHKTGPYRRTARNELIEALCRQHKPEARTHIAAAMAEADGKRLPGLTLRLARLEKDLGNYEEAAKHYKKLFLVHPASVEGLAAADDLAWMVFHGKLPQPKFTDAEQISRAELLYRKGRFDLAAHMYKTLLAKEPSSVRFALALARCRYKGRHNEEAVEMLQRLVRKGLGEKDRAEALQLLSLLYWRMDRSKEFESSCKQLLEKGPPEFKKKALFSLALHDFEARRFKDAEA
ncbi:MAG: tetratricopeptide repeat protein, partial [Pseudomonadota bacterium]